MGKYTKEDILRMAREQNVRFVRLQFTDILGCMKNVAITVNQLEKALDNECMTDGSSIEGFVRIEESDMYLYPDYDSFVVLPWNHLSDGKTARLICDVYCSDRTPFIGDPRNVLKRAIKKADDMGYKFTSVRSLNSSFSIRTTRADRQPKLTIKQATLTLITLTSAVTADVICV